LQAQLGGLGAVEAVQLGGVDHIPGRFGELFRQTTEGDERQSAAGGVSQDSLRVRLADEGAAFLRDAAGEKQRLWVAVAEWLQALQFGKESSGEFAQADFARDVELRSHGIGAEHQADRGLEVTAEGG
jgi:hypothetical protein